jgi:sigma-B regulation protein RsbU (phosphoserine phosphatase)
MAKLPFEILIAPNPPQIALLDWEMPRLDGLHVCRAVRTLPAKNYTYMIMVTARDQAADVLAAFAAGVDDFLSKPVDGSQLLARLRCGERVLKFGKPLSAAHRGVGSRARGSSPAQTVAADLHVLQKDTRR